ncbi:hypothetical protein AHF37_04798 [Paragonimus kellicotti]|nr:hypothetical protein AHF37_04798 [Paragonimus kellicotti]
MSVCTRNKGTGVFLTHPTDQTTRVRPNSAVWRLQVLAGLHRENPTFILDERPECSSNLIVQIQITVQIWILLHGCSMYALVRGLPEPTFILIHDQVSNANSTQQSPRSLKSNRFSPEFTYEVRLAHHHVIGPSSGNKRLAKRLAAEAMLLELGFRRSNSPSLQSVLRCPRSTLNPPPAPSSDSLDFESGVIEADPTSGSGTFTFHTITLASYLFQRSSQFWWFSGNDAFISTARTLNCMPELFLSRWIEVGTLRRMASDNIWHVSNS